MYHVYGCSEIFCMSGKYRRLIKTIFSQMPFQKKIFKRMKVLIKMKSLLLNYHKNILDSEVAPFIKI